MRARWLLALGGTVALAFAAVAWATPVTIPGPDDNSQPIKLDAAGDAYFDPYQPSGFDPYNDECALGDDPVDENGTGDVGFTPASDGTFEASDAVDLFDGGLVLWVGDQVFEDPDQSGDLVGEQLTVGPTKLEGLRVKRVETALQGSPTLRSLIKLKNKSKRKPKKRTIVWDSDLGADTDEVVISDSSGDETLVDSDRWLVFADSAIAPNDAVGTLVLYGKGKGVKGTKVANTIGEDPEDGCVRFEMRVKVPKRSSRYLLFFTEAHDDGSGGLSDAVSAAQKFETNKPGGGVLEGLKKSVKRKVLNWDLAKGKP